MKKIFTLCCAILGMSATIGAAEKTDTQSYDCTMTADDGTNATVGEAAYTYSRTVTFTGGQYSEYFLTDKTSQDGNGNDTIIVNANGGYSGCKIVFSADEAGLANLQVKVQYDVDQKYAQYKGLDDTGDNGTVTDNNDGTYTMEFDFLDENGGYGIRWFDIQDKNGEGGSVTLYSVELIDYVGNQPSSLSVEAIDEDALVLTGSAWWGCSSVDNKATDVTFGSTGSEGSISISSEADFTYTLNEEAGEVSYEDVYTITLAEALGASETLTLSAVNSEGSAISGLSETAEGNATSISLTLSSESGLSSVAGITLTGSEGLTISVTSVTLERKVVSDVAYTWEGDMEIYADPAENFWSQKAISLADLIGNLVPADVTSITFTGADAFIVGYNATDGEWYFTDAATSVTLTDIDFGEDYYVALVTQANDSKYHSFSWVAYGESIDPDWSSISEIKSDVDAIEVSRYNLLGQKISGEQKGINIIVYSDGSSKKVLVK